MANGVGWDLLNNGSMINAAYEVYNGSAAFNGYILPMLYIMFQGLLWYKTKKPVPGLVMGILFMTMYFTEMLLDTQVYFITGKFMAVIISTFIIQLGAWLWAVLVK